MAFNLTAPALISLEPYLKRLSNFTMKAAIQFNLFSLFQRHCHLSGVIISFFILVIEKFQ